MPRVQRCLPSGHSNLATPHLERQAGFREVKRHQVRRQSQGAAGQKHGVVPKVHRQPTAQGWAQRHAGIAGHTEVAKGFATTRRRGKVCEKGTGPCRRNPWTGRAGIAPPRTPSQPWPHCPCAPPRCRRSLPAVTAVPNNITGFRPARSATRPATKRLPNAPMVNNATIQPIKWWASMLAKYPGHSGSNIPKLAMNRTVPEQRSQNVLVKSG